MVLLLLNLATHNILTTTIVYQVRCFNRPKPDHVLDWVLDKLREKYTRITLAWWLHPTARSGVVIDGTWSMARKFTPVIGPTIVGEDYTDEERLLDYLLATFHPGRDKKSVTQISMFLIFQAMCTAELPLIDIPDTGNNDGDGEQDHPRSERRRQNQKTKKKAVSKKNNPALAPNPYSRAAKSHKVLTITLKHKGRSFSDKRLSAQSQGTLQWEQDLAEDLQSHYLSVVR
jgi:hypothetical protein